MRREADRQSIRATTIGHSQCPYRPTGPSPSSRSGPRLLNASDVEACAPYVHTYAFRPKWQTAATAVKTCELVPHKPPDLAPAGGRGQLPSLDTPIVVHVSGPSSAGPLPEATAARGPAPAGRELYLFGRGRPRREPLIAQVATIYKDQSAVTTPGETSTGRARRVS